MRGLPAIVSAKSAALTSLQQLYAMQLAMHGHACTC